jgi:tight adherence protein B
LTPIVAILLLVVLAIVLGILGLGVGVYLAMRTRDEMSQRIDHFVEPPRSPLALQPAETETFLGRLRRQFNTLFAGLDSEDMQRKLVAANWPITGGEYWFIRVGAALLALVIGLGIFGNILPGAGLAVLAYIVPGFMLFRSIQARQKRFQDQLIDSLTMIRGAVAAGYSFQQALNVVIDEMDPPSSDEFRQVRREVELGLPLGRALFNMASRMESDDFNLVATVIIINIQVGGNHTTILNVVV